MVQDIRFCAEIILILILEYYIQETNHIKTYHARAENLECLNGGGVAYASILEIVDSIPKSDSMFVCSANVCFGRYFRYLKTCFYNITIYFNYMYP